jgi:glycerol-3-phosphate dehydrogenase
MEDDAVVEIASREEGYRLVVCACEHVSAAEIHASLRGAVPARSIDGVRKRTRACAGRCQGAYCSAGVGFMLSVAHGCAPWEVPQSDPAEGWAVDGA